MTGQSHINRTTVNYNIIMDIETAREYSLSKKATTEDLPFGEDVLVIRVMGKMFLCINLNTPDRITMKCEPEYALELRERYNAIEGAWHFNKKYWNQVFWIATQMTN